MLYRLLLFYNYALHTAKLQCKWGHQLSVILAVDGWERPFYSEAGWHLLNLLQAL